jgi:transposase
VSDQRRRFTKEFKEQAVELVNSSDKSVAEIAHELGVRSDQLYRWKRSLEADGSQAFRGNGKVRQDELAELRKENARLKEERDILRKAVAIFSDRRR